MKKYIALGLIFSALAFVGITQAGIVGINGVPLNSWGNGIGITGARGISGTLQKNVITINKIKVRDGVIKKGFKTIQCDNSTCEWQQISSPSGTYSVFEFDSKNTPYLLIFNKESPSGKKRYSVKKYNKESNTWEDFKYFDTPFNMNGWGYRGLELGINKKDEIYIIAGLNSNGTDKQFIHKYNGENWIQLPTMYNVEYGNLVFDAQGDPIIASQGFAVQTGTYGHYVSIQKWNGNSWENISPNLHYRKGFKRPRLAMSPNNELYVAFEDINQYDGTDEDNVQVMKYNKSLKNWSTIGTLDNIYQSSVTLYNLIVDSEETIYVFMYNYFTSPKVKIMKYKNNSWSQITGIGNGGSPNSTYGNTSIAVDADDTLYVFEALRSVKKWNGSDWTKVIGTEGHTMPTNSSNANYHITFDKENILHIGAYINGGNYLEKFAPTE